MELDHVVTTACNSSQVVHWATGKPESPTLEMKCKLDDDGIPVMGRTTKYMPRCYERKNSQTLLTESNYL